MFSINVDNSISRPNSNDRLSTSFIVSLNVINCPTIIAPVCNGHVASHCTDNVWPQKPFGR